MRASYFALQSSLNDGVTFCFKIGSAYVCKLVRRVILFKLVI